MSRAHINRRNTFSCQDSPRLHYRMRNVYGNTFRLSRTVSDKLFKDENNTPIPPRLFKSKKTFRDADSHKEKPFHMKILGPCSEKDGVWRD